MLEFKNFDKPDATSGQYDDAEDEEEADISLFRVDW